MIPYVHSCTRLGSCYGQWLSAQESHIDIAFQSCNTMGRLMSRFGMNRPGQIEIVPAQQLERSHGHSGKRHQHQQQHQRAMISGQDDEESHCLQQWEPVKSRHSTNLRAHLLLQQPSQQSLQPWPPRRIIPTSARSCKCSARKIFNNASTMGILHVRTVQGDENLEEPALVPSMVGAAPHLHLHHGRAKDAIYDLSQWRKQ
ncbi:hypothetical protein ABZP36_035973 [Zizania latifolia]